MLKSYKVEIKPTTKQIQKIEQSIGVCRWLYNEYLSTNNQLYTKYKDGFIDKKQVFMSANDFDKYINNWGINLQKKNKVDHKSPFTECGLY